MLGRKQKLSHLNKLNTTEQPPLLVQSFGDRRVAACHAHQFLTSWGIPLQCGRKPVQYSR